MNEYKLKSFTIQAMLVLSMVAAIHACTRPAQGAQRVWTCDTPKPLEQGSGTVRFCHWVDAPKK